MYYCIMYILPVTSLVNILSWPGTVKSILHSRLGTCNILLIQNDPGRSISFFTVKSLTPPGFEPGSPDQQTNALPTRPKCLH